MLLLRADAATDPQMAALRAEIDAGRLRRMTSNARRLQQAGQLRADLSAERAGEIMWAYSSPELYELLVLHRHWPPGQYGQFIADAMIAALLPPPGAGQPRRSAGGEGP